MAHWKTQPFLKSLINAPLIICMLYSNVWPSPSHYQTLAERLGYNKTDKLLIINGDDAGMCHSVNVATIKALEKGLMKSASIMVPCPGFQEIASYAKSTPGRDFGVHITLTSEWEDYRWGPVTHRAAVASLTDSLGYFWPDLKTLISNARLKDIENEARNQIVKALAAGVDVTHLDSHMYSLQYIRRYIPVYLKLASEFNLPIRLCTLWDKEGVQFKRANLEAYGLVSPDYLLNSYYKNGESVKEHWIRLLKSLKPGVSELYIHTALPGREIQSIASRDWQVRVEEYRIFVEDEEIHQIIRDEGIKIIGYRELRDLQRASNAGKLPISSLGFYQSFVRQPISRSIFMALLAMLIIGLLLSAISVIQHSRIIADICRFPENTLENLAERPDTVGAFAIVMCAYSIFSLTILLKARATINELGKGFQLRHAFFILGGVFLFCFGEWLFKSIFIGVFARALRKKIKFSYILCISGFSGVPQLLFRAIIMAVATCLSLGFNLNLWLANILSLARFFPKAAATNPSILSMLWHIEVFGLWSIFLTALGIKSLFKTRLKGPFIIAILYWVLTGAVSYIIQIEIGNSMQL